MDPLSVFLLKDAVFWDLSRCFRNVGERYHMKPNHVWEDGTPHKHSREIVTCNIIISAVIIMEVIILNNFLKRSFGLILDLLSTYTHDSELQAITSPSLFFSTLLPSLAVPWQRLLIVEIVQLHALKSSLHSLPYRTDSVTPVVFLITALHGPNRKHGF
jgi:hypothetical protein